MISRIDFGIEMERLHRSFGSAEGRKIEEKIDEWHTLWEKQFSQVSLDILTKMVDRAVSRCERLPSFAQFITIKAEVMANDISVMNYPRTPCSVCEATGIIEAERQGYRYSFCCHCCENWKGRYDGIPMWETEKHGGEFFPIKTRDGFDLKNMAQVKGLAMMREVTPRPYERVTEGKPDLRAAVDAPFASGWTPSGFKTMPEPYGKKPMSESEKERRRAESLAREAEREPGDDTEDIRAELGY